MDCQHIEYAVANYFSWRVNLIVPRVSWGLWIHECDLLIVTKSGYCYEVEIKTSRSDLIADLNKKHGHKSNRIRRLYFAIPEKLRKDIEFIPERAGILIVNTLGRCKKEREAQIEPSTRKLTDEERYQVARLGTMRIWSLIKTIEDNYKMINYWRERSTFI
jgi:hypothetical protein